MQDKADLLMGINDYFISSKPIRKQPLRDQLTLGVDKKFAPVGLAKNKNRNMFEYL